MSTLKVGDIVVSLTDDQFESKGVTYKSLIKGGKYKVVDIRTRSTHPIELEPLSDPDVFVYAKPEELELVDSSADKQYDGSKRYRVLGYTPDLDGTFSSKSETIFQCDSFEDALDHLRKAHNENIECTYFTIRRGEWL